MALLDLGWAFWPRTTMESQTRSSKRAFCELQSLRVQGTGDKFGESLRGSQASLSFWKVPGLPRKFPQLPQKFFGDFPGSSLTVELSSNPGVPRKFPRLPRKFPELPRRFPGLPRRSAPFLGSLTPSLDLQNLPLKETLLPTFSCQPLANPSPTFRAGFPLLTCVVTYGLISQVMRRAFPGFGCTNTLTW